MTRDIAIERGLPMNLDAERFVLGSLLLDTESWEQVSDLNPEDFLLEANRKTFRLMSELRAQGQRIDRVTLAEEFTRKSQLDSVGGLSYLLSLDEGLPQIPNIESYARIVAEKSTLRKIILTAQSIQDRAFLGDDPKEILASLSRIAADLGASQPGQRRLVSAGEVIDQVGADAFIDPRLRMKPRVFLPWPDFEWLWTGLFDSQLIVLAADTGCGKSAFAGQIAADAAQRQGVGTAVFTLEMANEQILRRMTYARAEVSFRQTIEAGDALSKFRLAASDLTDSPLWFDDAGSLTVAQIENMLRRSEAAGNTIGFVVVDYLQLMTGKGENRTQEVAGISRGLKQIAMRFKIPVMAISQFRGVPSGLKSNGRTIGDLKESTSIGQDADVIVFLEPQSNELDGEKVPIIDVDVSIHKQRGGATGKRTMSFVRPQTKFMSRVSQ